MPATEGDSRREAPEVWLVNDDPAQLLVQKRLLGRFAATVWEFRSPAELMTQARRYGSCPNLVADIHMPGMSGLELARVWCELHPNARVLLTSASCLSSREAEEATFLPNNRVKLLTEYRIPELLSVAAEWFEGVSEEELPIPAAEAQITGELKFFDSDVHSKLSLLGGRDFLRKALSRFADKTPDRLRACREASEKTELQRVHREAHSLKGSCGIVGATPMFQAADELEAAAQEGRSDGDLIHLVEELETLWSETEKEFTHILTALEEPQT